MMKVKSKMKIGLITDLHWGARNDSQHFIDFYDKFYTDTFFPVLAEQGIDTVLILGDVFDRRRHISFVTLNHSKRILFDQLAKRGIKAYVLVGNHDAPYKNTIKINAVNLLLSDYDNITVINEPQDIQIAEHTVCCIPWICQDNVIEAMTLMESSTAPVCVGHFEITGFSMYKNVAAHEGLDRSLFDRFDSVFSGHYHHRSTMGNITYLGNPYELTWQDYNDPRGFHIFDLETRQLEFVENPHRLFKKIVYDDSAWTGYADVTAAVDAARPERDSYIKLIVQTKSNPIWFDAFIDQLEKGGLIELQVIDVHDDHALDTDEAVDEAEDTVAMLKKYIDNFETSADKKQLNNLMQSLYHEALSVQ